MIKRLILFLLPLLCAAQVPTSTVKVNPTTGALIDPTAATFKSANSIGSGSGSVTSIAVTGANGIGVSGSPITVSGTVALSLGAITPTTVNGITFSGTGSFSTAGAISFPAVHSVSFTANGATTLTLPETGTLATRDGTETLTNKTMSTSSTWSGNTVGILFGGTGATTASAARNALLPSKTGNAGKVLAVNGGETDYELIAVSGTGTVTSVSASDGNGFDFTVTNPTTTPAISLAMQANYGLTRYGFADRAAVLAATGQFAGQLLASGGAIGFALSTTPGDVAAPVVFGVGQTYWVDAMQFQAAITQTAGTAQLKSLTVSTGNFAVTSGDATISDGLLTQINTATTERGAAFSSGNTSGASPWYFKNTAAAGLSNADFVQSDDIGGLTIGTGNASASARYARKARIESFYGLAGGLGGKSMPLIFAQYGEYSGTDEMHTMAMFDSDNGITFYKFAAASADESAGAAMTIAASGLVTVTNGLTASSGAITTSSSGIDVANTDTTITRSAAGVLAVEGVPLRSPTLGTEQASTSGTSIDFTSIPSGVRKIFITLVGVSTSGTSNLYVQLGDAGGIETSGYTSNAATLGNGAVGAMGATVTAAMLISGTAPVASYTYDGTITLTLEDSSDNTWSSSHLINRSGTVGIYTGAGTKATSAELDRVRITTANGTDTFDAGVINILYQ